jgi:hypothetical protein
MTASADAMPAEITRHLETLYNGAPPESWLVISWPDPESTTNGKPPPMLSA